MTNYRNAAFGFAIAAIILAVLMIVFGYVGMNFEHKYETCKSAYQQTLQSELQLAKAYKYNDTDYAEQAIKTLKGAPDCE